MFSLEKETPTHYIVKHPKGDVLKIAKSGLSPQMHSTIKKMADGGQAQAPNPISQGFNNAMGAQGIKQAAANIKNYADGTPPGGAGSDNSESPEESAEIDNIIGKDNSAPQQQDQPPQPPVTINIHNGREPSADQSQPNQSSQADQSDAPQGAQVNPSQKMTPASFPQPPQGPNLPNGVNPGSIPNLQGQLQGDLGLVQKGAQQEAAAKAAMGDQGAAIQHQGIVQQYALNQQIARNAQDETDQLHSVADDFNNKNLDFNRAWANKSTPKKIMAGIGMFLSGLGSGLTGQPNMALKMINDEIERDIREQMANKDNKKTAFSMYQQAYGNKDLALKAQMLHSQALVAAQMNEMIYKNGGPQAEAQKNLLLGQYMPQIQKGIYDVALQKAGLDMIGGGAGNGGGNQLTSGMQPASTNINGNQLNQPSQMEQGAPDEQENSDAVIPSNLGRTGAVNLNALTGYQRLGWMPKEDLANATKEAKEFQESQTTKSMLLKDLSDMGNAIQQNNQSTMATLPNGKQVHKPISIDPLGMLKGQQMLSKLPFEVGKSLGEMEPWGGEISRKFAAAKASALNKVNTLLTKRIGGEAMKNIEVQLPDRSDSPKEMRDKIKRIMTLIDANTATPTLDRYRLIHQ